MTKSPISQAARLIFNTSRQTFAEHPDPAKAAEGAVAVYVTAAAEPAYMHSDLVAEFRRLVDAEGVDDVKVLRDLRLLIGEVAN